MGILLFSTPRTCSNECKFNGGMRPQIKFSLPSFDTLDTIYDEDEVLLALAEQVLFYINYWIIFIYKS